MNTAIVTGGAQGIGFAIAARLIEDGFFILLADKNEKAGKEAANKLGEEKARFFPVDVGDENSVASFFNTINSNYPGFNVLVNNAGIVKDRIIWKMEAGEFDDVIRVNLRGTWLMCREAAKIFKQNKQGSIINISSRAWMGNPGQTNYSASKAGVVGITRSLALEMGRYKVTVNAIAPGLIDTPLVRNLPSNVQTQLIEAQPTKEMGKPGDIASLTSYLASPEARFITGQIFHVDGGKSIGAMVK